MEPGVGQRTGRTWFFVSTPSVRRFFPSADSTDEGSNGSNWMPKSLQKRGKETKMEVGSAVFMQACHKKSKRFYFFLLLFFFPCHDTLTDFQPGLFLTPSSIFLQCCCSSIQFQPKPDTMIFSLHKCLSVSFTIVRGPFLLPSKSFWCSRREGGQRRTLSVTRVCTSAYELHRGLQRK